MTAVRVGLCLLTCVVWKCNILMSLAYNFSDKSEGDRHLKLVLGLQYFDLIQLPEDGTVPWCRNM